MNEVPPGRDESDDADDLLRRHVERDVARRHDRAECLLEIAHRQDGVHDALSGTRRSRPASV